MCWVYVVSWGSKLSPLFLQQSSSRGVREAITNDAYMGYTYGLSFHRPLRLPAYFQYLLFGIKA